MKRPSGVPHTPKPGDGQKTPRPERDGARSVEPPERSAVERPGSEPAVSDSRSEARRGPESTSARDSDPGADAAPAPTGWVAEALNRARAAAGAQAASSANAASDAGATDKTPDTSVDANPVRPGASRSPLTADDEATQDLSALRAPTSPASARNDASGSVSSVADSGLTGSATADSAIFGSAASATTVPSSAERESASGRRPVADPLAPERAGRTAREAKRERKRFERAEVRRFTVRSRRRRRAWLIGIGSVAAVALLAVIVSYTPILSVRKIEVRGTERLSASSLEHKLSGELGTPFPLVDQSAIKAVLTEFPLIESYRVESSPPSTLILRIVERTPVGVVAVDGGFELVDAAGVVIERTGEKPADYPVITVDRSKSMDAFRAAAAVLRTMPEDLRVKVSSIGATTRDDVTFGLVDSETVVLWGDASDGVVKAKLLEALMRAQPDAQRFNVTSPEIGVVG
ncbi:FtsQ-type POTRA domain-containing protein [Mycetocola sp. JXN-3]|uniref:FtsQ-type POTRA domain-containing protein n=1 Tax=Mycetocola sp. JXN-3 TaxID=2116510 RepID=UPI00165D2CBC|nr:FtsQ-type POTRA domain-containing protein [Mycetocola sp. JXN-3]